MTFDEFDKIKDRFQELENMICATKGKEYSNGDDRLGNFKRMAVKRGITPIKAAALLLDKHLDAIDYVINGKKELSESFEQRLLDARVYLMLIYALYIEKEEQTKIKSKSEPYVYLCPKCAGDRVTWIGQGLALCESCKFKGDSNEFKVFTKVDKIHKSAIEEL